MAAKAKRAGGVDCLILFLESFSFLLRITREERLRGEKKSRRAIDPRSHALTVDGRSDYSPAKWREEEENNEKKKALAFTPSTLAKLLPRTLPPPFLSFFLLLLLLLVVVGSFSCHPPSLLSFENLLVVVGDWRRDNQQTRQLRYVALTVYQRLWSKRRGAAVIEREEMFFFFYYC